MSDAPAGVDLDSVSRWLVANVDGVELPLRCSLISGGRSNLTYRIDDAAGRTLVLRRPPLGNVLATAHDMGREWRIISALAGTPVPVAPAVAWCPDESVNGAPFYVMGYVEGLILDTAGAASKVDEAARKAAGTDMVTVMAALHAIEPDDVGLGTLGRREDYIGRQLRRWHQQWEKSKTRELPAVDEVHRRLSTGIPPQQRSGIVHGDFRLGNMMVGPDGRIRAVLDWELATLGDVLADLGWMLSSWTEPGEAPDVPGAPPTTAPGFPSRAEMTGRYERLTGLDLSSIAWYVAFARWRSVCITEGVYARYKAGVMGGDDFDFEAFDAQIQRTAAAALAALETL
ncbi:MAG TPA: phosphotransferase family protein [Acidimicrobiales bacterium]|nr:phosphotransferase family protein [Acidimicrobiales bacterium]